MACADWRGSRARFSNEFEHQEDRSGVGRIGEGRAREADHVHAVRDAGHAERHVERPLLRGVGARQRRAGRQLNHDDHVAGVDLRNKADRRQAELIEAETDHDEINDHHHRDAAHRARRHPGDAGTEAAEAAIEQGEEAVNRPLPPAVAMRRIVRLEQERAHRRRQRQRDDQRNDGGAGDGQRELPVKLPGDAGNEYRGHEHGAQYERDGNQRRADLVHALARRFARMQAGGDVALDVLDHDDGIIDHDADRQHQAEQRQIVEREAERGHEEERADQRHRYGNERNDRRAPGLQEQNDHDHDKQGRLADGLDHGVDRLLNELGRIEENVVFDPGREALRQFCHQALDALGGCKRIGAGALENGERHRRVVIEIGIRRIIERRQLNSADILQPHHGAGRLLHHDRGELVGIGEPSKRLHRDLKGAGMRDRRLIKHAGRDLDVLPLQRAGDVGRGQPQRLQAIRIEPHPHRIVAGAEYDDRADAVDAGDRIRHFKGGVIGDEQRIARLVGRIEMHDHHQIRR